MYDVLVLAIHITVRLCVRRVIIYFGFITNHAYKFCITSEIIFTRWTFNFMYYVGRTINEFKTKYLFILIVVSII